MAKRKPRPSEVSDAIGSHLLRAGCDPMQIAHCERPNIVATTELVRYIINQEGVSLGQAVASCFDQVMIQRLVRAEDDEFGFSGHIPPTPSNQRQQRTTMINDRAGNYEKHFEVPSELAWLFRCNVATAAEEMGVKFWSTGGWLWARAKKWEAVFTLTLPPQSARPPSSCVHTLRRAFEAGRYHPVDSIKRAMRDVAAEELARLAAVLSPLALRME